MIHKEFRVIMDMKLGSLLVRGKSFKEEEEAAVNQDDNLYKSPAPSAQNGDSVLKAR